MVDVVVPHVASLLAATADRARREGAAEAGRVAAAQRRAFYDEGVAHGRAEGAAEAGDRIAQAIEAEREKWAARFPVPEGWDLDYILRRDGTYSGLDRAARIARSTP